MLKKTSLDSFEHTLHRFMDSPDYQETLITHVCHIGVLEKKG